MNKKLLLSLFCSSLVGSTTILKADEIKLTSTATSEITLGLGVLAPPSTLSVDWGDGVFVDYVVDKDGSSSYDLYEAKGTPAGTKEITIKGAGIAALDCDFSLDFPETVTALDVTGAANLTRLLCTNQSIATLDLSHCTSLARVELNNSKNKNLTEISLPNSTSLTYLNCSGNGLSEINVSNNPSLDYLNISLNRITSVDLSKNVKLRDLFANDNQIKEADIASCGMLRTVSLQNNQLETLTGAEVVVTKNSWLRVQNNKLNLATLPALPAGVPETRYVYQPQLPYELPGNISVGQELDLSSQTNAKGILTAPVATTYTWTTESGVALVPGTDYTESDGRFVFLATQAEPVFCTMTTTAFPKFTATGASAFVTTPVSISSSSAMDAANQNGHKVYAVNNVLNIEGLEGSERISVNNLQGVSAYSAIATSRIVSVQLAAGVYVVAVDGRVSKIIVE